MICIQIFFSTLRNWYHFEHHIGYIAWARIVVVERVEQGANDVLLGMLPFGCDASCSCPNHTKKFVWFQIGN